MGDHGEANLAMMLVGWWFFQDPNLTFLSQDGMIFAFFFQDGLGQKTPTTGDQGSTTGKPGGGEFSEQRAARLCASHRGAMA